MPISAVFMSVRKAHFHCVYIFTYTTDEGSTEEIKKLVCATVTEMFKNQKATTLKFSLSNLFVRNGKESEPCSKNFMIKLYNVNNLPLSKQGGLSDLMEDLEVTEIVGFVYPEKVKDLDEAILEEMADTLCNFALDVALLNKYIRRLELNAMKDPLTGLYNQQVFWEILDRELDRSLSMQVPLAVVVIDLNDFKKINDTYGHIKGDEILKKFASILKKVCRNTDIVARYGGDEFVVILPGANRETAQRYIGKLEEETERFNNNEGYSVSFSYGIAVSPEDGDDPYTLFSIADTMMYRCKNGYKRNGFAVPELILKAVENREVYPVFQPIIELKNQRLAGVEVLMRLKYFPASFGAVNFLEIADKKNLMAELELALLKQVVESWEKIPSRVDVFINASASLLGNFEKVVKFIDVIDAYGIPSERIVIEIPEKLGLFQNKEAKENLTYFKARGFKLAVDDLGSTISSYTNLEEELFDIDYVKIDGLTFKKAADDPKEQSRLEAIVRVMKSLDMSVVAEWVETDGDFELAQKIGVTHAQGFFFSTPMTLKQLEAYSSLLAFAAKEA